MIHVMLPVQYLGQAGARLIEPEKRLMLAILLTVVDDYQASRQRRAMRGGVRVDRAYAQATAYVASTDRTWPFSFENVCEAMGLDADRLREELDMTGPGNNRGQPPTDACDNGNHRHANSPVAHAPQWGGIVNRDNSPRSQCSNEHHAVSRRQASVFCVGCGTQLIINGP